MLPIKELAALALVIAICVFGVKAVPIVKEMHSDYVERSQAFNKCEQTNEWHEQLKREGRFHIVAPNYDRQ